MMALGIIIPVLPKLILNFQGGNATSAAHTLGAFGTVDIIIGQVIGIHIKDEFIQPDGKLNILKIRPLARLGYYDYTSIESVFEMIIPGPDEKVRSGMEGKKE